MGSRSLMIISYCFNGRLFYLLINSIDIVFSCRCSTIVFPPFFPKSNSFALNTYFTSIWQWDIRWIAHQKSNSPFSFKYGIISRALLVTISRPWNSIQYFSMFTFVMSIELELCDSFATLFIIGIPWFWRNLKLNHPQVPHPSIFINTPFCCFVLQGGPIFNPSRSELRYNHFSPSFIFDLSHFRLLNVTAYYIIVNHGNSKYQQHCSNRLTNFNRHP